jgi:hypothetical protein
MHLDLASYSLESGMMFITCNNEALMFGQPRGEVPIGKTCEYVIYRDLMYSQVLNCSRKVVIVSNLLCLLLKSWIGVLV